MIDVTNVQTRDGRKVTILSTEGPGDYPIVGYFNGTGLISTWTEDGTHYLLFPQSPVDLIEKPKPLREFWVIRYHNGAVVCRTTERAARKVQEACPDEVAEIIRVREVRNDDA